MRLVKKVLEFMDGGPKALREESMATFFNCFVEICQDLTIASPLDSCIGEIMYHGKFLPNFEDVRFPSKAVCEPFSANRELNSIKLKIGDFHILQFVAFVGNKALTWYANASLEVFVLCPVNVPK